MSFAIRRNPLLPLTYKELDGSSYNFAFMFYLSFVIGMSKHNNPL